MSDTRYAIIIHPRKAKEINISMTIPKANLYLAADEYQSKAHTTCMLSCDNPDYPTHEIIEEAVEHYDKFYKDLPEDQRNDIQLRTIHVAAMHIGQLAKARAKSVRHGEVPNVVLHPGTPDQRLEKAYELGDILWGVSEAARQYGFTLSQIMQLNLDKLAQRKQNARIEGDGDHR